MNPIMKFNRGIFHLPVGVKLWLLVLTVGNLLVPLMYLGRSEARIVLLTFLASFVLMVVITGTNGFTRLLGLGHIPWIPLLLYLVGRLDSIPAGDFYGVWVRSVVVLNFISVVIDAIDVARFARGERSEIVSVE
jgi:hypothetical protein